MTTSPQPWSRNVAFTRGLFYPWIDISDDAWLKTTMLYWDHVQTIVPADIRWPYQSDTSRAFHHAGLLTPHAVDPFSSDVQAVLPDVMKYLDTAEGLRVLAASPHQRGRWASHEDRQEKAFRIVEVHRSKLPVAVFDLVCAPRERYKPGYVGVDERFAAFYMTLLANRICEQYGLAPVTYDAGAARLTNSARVGIGARARQPFWREPRAERLAPNPEVPARLAQALMSEVAIERLNLDPATPVDKIIRFREKHRDELGRFRNKVGELVAPITDDIPIEALRQRVNDLHANEIGPALSDLKSALRSGGITYVADKFLKIWSLSIPVTTIPTALMGLSVPIALAVSTGFSMSAGVLEYDQLRKAQLRHSPYAYLLSVQRRFSRGRLPPQP
jgi:hypothetical protein